jgi:ABC-type multidrug transport system ATPase subunit
VIDVRHISRRFGNVIALKDVSFSARSGEILGLVGPNGAGKTTLLEILSGLLPAQSGTVMWRDTQLAPADRKHVMFYVPEAITPYPAESVGRVLRLFGRLFASEPERLPSIIKALRLAPALEMRVADLSKGYRRRLLIALGLLAPQPLLMMDEPFDGLDLRQTREVIGVLRQTAETGRTLLLSIHQLVDAQRVCDRFVLLSGGSVCGEGTLETLRGLARVGQAGLEEVFLALT